MLGFIPDCVLLSDLPRCQELETLFRLAGYVGGDGLPLDHYCWVPVEEDQAIHPRLASDLPSNHRVPRLHNVLPSRRRSPEASLTSIHGFRGSHRARLNNTPASVDCEHCGNQGSRTSCPRVHRGLFNPNMLRSHDHRASTDYPSHLHVGQRWVEGKSLEHRGCLKTL